SRPSLRRLLHIRIASLDDQDVHGFVRNRDARDYGAGPCIEEDEPAGGERSSVVTVRPRHGQPPSIGRESDSITANALCSAGRLDEEVALGPRSDGGRREPTQESAATHRINDSGNSVE